MIKGENKTKTQTKTQTQSKNLKENRIQNPWSDIQPKKEVGFGMLNSIIAQHYGEEYLKGEYREKHDKEYQ
jgi:hypothetical protein